MWKLNPGNLLNDPQTRSALFQALLISHKQRSINVMSENIIKDRVNLQAL